jgi:hypothetical protein
MCLKYFYGLLRVCLLKSICNLQNYQGCSLFGVTQNVKIKQKYLKGLQKSINLPHHTFHIIPTPLASSLHLFKNYLYNLCLLIA